MDEQKVDVVATEIELNGPERFAADNLVSPEDCEKLIKFANVSSRSYVKDIHRVYSQNQCQNKFYLKEII